MPGDANREPLLSVDAIRFSYGEWTLFRDLSVALIAGQALVLSGSNGSGKSTLLRLMAGLHEPDEGSVSRAIDAHGEPATISWLGHSLGLKTNFTIDESLAFTRHLNASRHGRPAAAALEAVGLAGFGPVLVRELSAGQRKRVALAGLLVAPAPIWLLDEPHANLDPDGHRVVDRLITEHLAQGGTVALSVHHPDLAGFHGRRELLHVDLATLS